MSESLLANAAAPINIAFNEIPFNVQVPGVYTEIAPNYSQAGLVGYQAATLMLVPVLESGTLPLLTPTQVFVPAAGSALVGPGGIGDAMIRATLTANPWNPLYVMGVSSGGTADVAALGTIQAQPTASMAAGVAAIAVGGIRYTYNTTTADTGNSVAAGLISAINADPDTPVIATASGGYITLTAKEPGPWGNAVNEAVNPGTSDSTPTGLALHVIVGGTAYASGTMTGGGTGATEASWSVQAQITSSLTVSGTYALYINGTGYYVPVTVGIDSGNSIATNLLEAVNANTLCPLWAVEATGGYVTLEAKDVGTIGNQTDVRVNLNPGDANVPGVGNTITFTAATGLPSVSAALAAVATFACTDIICPWNDSTSAAAVQTELDRRFNAMVELDAVAYGAYSETTLTTLLSDTSGLNSRMASYVGLQHSPTPPYLLAAMYGGVASFNLLNDPARQLRTLVLPGAVAPALADRLIETERQAMLVGGMATLNVNRDGTVSIERAVTTYQSAPGNVPDSSYRDIMTVKVLQRIRYDWRNFVKLQYPRAKMAADGTLAAEYDPNVVTPRKMQTSWAARCKLYEQLGWIQNSATTAAQSVFQLDTNNPNQMDAVYQLNVMNNLMILAGRIEFSQFVPAAGTAQQ